MQGVSASTQSQAKSALLFLYRDVLAIELPRLVNVASARTPKRLPAVLTVDEVRKLLECVEGTGGLMLRLIYGTGMRLRECFSVRVRTAGTWGRIDYHELRALTECGGRSVVSPLDAPRPPA